MFLKLLICTLFIGTVYSQERMIDMIFSARSLPSKDSLPPSQSDPFVELFMHRDDEDIDGQRFGKSSFIPNNNNPNWPETFRVFYNPNLNQKVRVDVYDDDGALESQYIATTYFTLKELFEAHENYLTKDFNPSPGSLQVRASVHA